MAGAGLAVYNYTSVNSWVGFPIVRVMDVVVVVLMRKLLSGEESGEQKEHGPFQILLLLKLVKDIDGVIHVASVSRGSESEFPLAKVSKLKLLRARSLSSTT